MLLYTVNDTQVNFVWFGSPDYTHLVWLLMAGSSVQERYPGNLVWWSKIVRGGRGLSIPDDV
jgi:hypothetical protein